MRASCGHLKVIEYRPMTNPIAKYGPFGSRCTSLCPNEYDRRWIQQASYLYHGFGALLTNEVRKVRTRGAAWKAWPVFTRFLRFLPLLFPALQLCRSPRLLFTPWASVKDNTSTPLIVSTPSENSLGRRVK